MPPIGLVDFMILGFVITQSSNSCYTSKHHSGWFRNLDEV